MKLVTPEQMREIDRKAIEEVGIPGIVLMENAALQVAMKAAEILNQNKGSKVLVLAGCGNNGGDGLAAARHLLSMDYAVTIYTLCPPLAYKGDAKINADILLNMGVSLHHLEEDCSLEAFESALLYSDLVIDGLYGTGLNRDLSPFVIKIIQSVNRYSKYTLAIDIPSGIDGLTGKIMRRCIKAHATVTLFLPKTGMVQYPAAAFIGQLTVADICIPYPLTETIDTMVLSDAAIISSILPERPEASHKGSFGRVLIIAGSQGMTGAAYLAASAAYRTGTGLVRLAVPSSLVPSLSIMVPEAVLSPLAEHEGAVGEVDEAFVKDLLDQSDAVLLGPGLSQTPYTEKLVKLCVSLCEKPLVLDADALNILAKNPECLKTVKTNVILTPHPAEMARLTGLKTAEVQENRTEIASRFAKEQNVTIVLKGASTVITAPDGRVTLNPTGNSGMATAGSGDVLAGMIASLLGQKVNSYDAALAGVYLHGLSGDLAAVSLGEASIMASDIIGHIGKAIQTIK